ncbi:MAG: hypothetical protein WCP35_05385 [Verrucomicrobiota bacterium]
MKHWRKPLIVLAAVLLAGAVRLPLEAALTNELRGAGLLAAPLPIDTREKIGQTSAAVALGGLRTLVATFLNLRAYTFFTETRWDDVAATFDTIVELAPQTIYYWQTGAWHQAYNASSYYLNDSNLPPLRRDAAWRASVLKGRAFLERGIHNNPGDPKLNTYLGYLLTDHYKSRAFRDIEATFLAAAEAYKTAADAPEALPFLRRFQLYALARVAERQDEALALARQIYQNKAARTPTMQCIYFVLEVAANPNIIDPGSYAISVFGSAEKAYANLANYWLRTSERLPVHGVAKALKVLEETLGIAGEKSIFLQHPVQDAADE